MTRTTFSTLSSQGNARQEYSREAQRQRFAGMQMPCNADMGPTEVRQMCRLDEASGERTHRGTAHLVEAIQYRPRRAVR
jgi:predicted ATPase with chaperone activity